MTQQAASPVLGTLTPEERTIIGERDGYVAEFHMAGSEAERISLLEKVEEATRRYDEVRARRRAAGEIE